MISARIRTLDCRTVHHRIAAWVDAELSPVESARLEEHLDTCPNCATFANRIRQQSEALSTLARTGTQSEVSDDFWEPMNRSLSEELDAFEQREWKRGSFFVSRWSQRRFSVPVAMAVSYMAVLCFVGWWGWSQSETETEPMVPVATTEPAPVQDVESDAAHVFVDVSTAKMQFEKTFRERTIIPGSSTSVQWSPQLVRPTAYRPHRGSF